jgi:arabinofuranosyltransferase
VAVWAPAATIGVAGFLNRWNSEDAFINFRVVDQLLAGNGPVFNAGERAEAATSTLWLAVLSLGSLLPGGIEWFAVLAGLAGTVAGLALASTASVRLACVGTGGTTLVGGLWLPFGSLVFVALPPVWHFATSGLETGLSFAWLGGSFLALVTSAGGSLGGRSRFGTAVLLGLGPLVRPDLAVFSVAFLAGLLVVHRRRGLRWAAVTVAVAVALPVAYQVFRMGYYGSLVPTPALAKEASGSRVDQGLTYLGDFALPYLLWLPLAVVLLVLGLAVRRWGVRSATAVVALAPVLAGLLHGVFVVRVGGDFMHARLLLPALFGILLPLAVVPLRRGLEAAVAVPVAVVATWALVTAVDLRTEYHGTMAFRAENGWIADEHGFYVAASGKAHPVTLEDYQATNLYRLGARIRQNLASGESYVNPDVYEPGNTTDVKPRGDVDQVVVTTVPNVGVVGFLVGPDVWVVDVLGLGDPFAARTALPPDRPGRIGHEKLVHPAWVLARFAAEPPQDDPEVTAAVRALGCGDVERLESAVRAPLTAGRFVENLFASPALTALRLDPLPSVVAAEQC